MPGGLHRHAHADSSLLQFSVELLSFTIAVIQLSFPALPSFLIHKSDLLKARVIIYAYNDHVRLLPPEPLVVMQPQFTRVEGADFVMKSSWISGYPTIYKLKIGAATYRDIKRPPPVFTNCISFFEAVTEGTKDYWS